MTEDLKYELCISPGSGWEGANWLLIFSVRKHLKNSTTDSDCWPDWSSHVLGAFRDRDDAEAARDEMLRGFILQAASMSPSSERR